jgi:hypothetical protein
MDLSSGKLPVDLDISWYITEARKLIPEVDGYRHQSPQLLDGHPLATEVLTKGLAPCPKWAGKRVLAGADPARPTYLWD